MMIYFVIRFVKRDLYGHMRRYIKLPWLAHVIEYTMTFDQIGKRLSEILLHLTDINTKSACYL